MEVKVGLVEANQAEAKAKEEARAGGSAAKVPEELERVHMHSDQQHPQAPNPRQHQPHRLQHRRQEEDSDDWQ